MAGCGRLRSGLHGHDNCDWKSQTFMQEKKFSLLLDRLYIYRAKRERERDQLKFLENYSGELPEEKIRKVWGSCDL